MAHRQAVMNTTSDAPTRRARTGWVALGVVAGAAVGFGPPEPLDDHGDDADGP